METITCRTLYGETKQVSVDKLVIYPGVYAIIIHEDSVLLLKSQATGKWMQPGGGIQKGETIEQALQREMLEEVGIQVAIDKFAHFQADFFYYDPLDKAFQGYLFFYYCTPLTLELQPPDPETEEGIPYWVEINNLTAEDFESHGEVTMHLILGHLPSNSAKHDPD